MTDYYGGSAKNRGAPPQPPPKPVASATARRVTSRRANTTRTASKPKPTYQSSRSTAPSRPSENTDSKAMPNRSNASLSSRGGAVKNRSTLAGAKKAPVASRPVGSYYNSNAAATGSEIMNSGVGATNPYSSSVPQPASTSGTDANDLDTDTWDDWGSPAAKTSTTTSANPHSSWAAPAPSKSSSSSTTDWYSAGGAAATTSAAPAGYTSSGFINQPSQPQKQQEASMQPGNSFYQSQGTQQNQQPFLSGAMDSSAPTMSSVNPNNAGMKSADSNAAPGVTPSFSMFLPSESMQQQSQNAADSYPMEDEAPLLEELGINIQHMTLKSKAVAFPFSRFGGDQIDPAVICQDGDLIGPIALLLLLACEMVLTGKLQFGYIYIYGLSSCVAMTMVVNLISPTDAIHILTVTSIMGYALLPVNILALIKIFVVNLINMQTLGNILGALTVLWSTMASTRLLELGCGLRDQRYLIMYPLFLIYSLFVMMTIW